MRKPFRALLLKETQEIWMPMTYVLWFFMFMIAVAAIRDGSAGIDSNPGRRYDWGSFVTAIAAAIIGYLQTSREGRGDRWTFALHRPASGGQIFGAKLITGVMAVVISMLVPYLMVLWWPSVSGHRVVPLDRSYVLGGIADFFATLTWYAAGLYAGSRRFRAVSRALGFGVAFLGTIVVMAPDSFVLAIAGSVALTALLATAACSDFMHGSDFEAQPFWGRTANVLCGVATIVVTVSLVVGFVASSKATSDFLARQETPGFIGPKVIDPAWEQSGPAIITGDRLETVLPPAVPGPGSYRDSRRYVRRLFPSHPGPIWYMEQREGLISLYDRYTGRQVGWLGPDGYSAGIPKPARRFVGDFLSVTQHYPRAAFLLTSEAVYRIDSLSARHVFTAPQGETIVDAAASVGGDTLPQVVQQSSWFTAVTTNARMYVVGDSGRSQLSVAHPETGPNLSVRVRRDLSGPAAPTTIWYEPETWVPGDTMNYAFVFKNGSTAPSDIRRFGRASTFIPGGATLESQQFTLSGGVALSPAAQLYALIRATREERGAAARMVALSVIIGLLLAAVTFWFCRGYAFSQRRAGAWAALTAALGPIALVIMWLFLDWPARERCAGCGKGRAVSRMGCEHCDAPFTTPLGGAEYRTPWRPAEGISR